MSRQSYIRRSCTESPARRFFNSLVSKTARRIALATAITGLSMTATHADESEILDRIGRGGGISILVHEFSSAAINDSKTDIPSTEPAATIASLPAYESLGTHDSVPVAKRASRFDQSIAAAVFASASKIGISIEQVLEPFAVVGPIANQAPATMQLSAYSDKEVLVDADQVASFIEDVTVKAEPTDRQLAEAVALNRWWLDTETVAVAKVTSQQIVKAAVVEESKETELNSADSIDAAIAELTAEEPLDVQDTIASPSDSRLVGSSPMIVTIEEAYLPYDLAKRDLEFRYLPLSTVIPRKPENYVTFPQASEEVIDSQRIAPQFDQVNQSLSDLATFADHVNSFISRNPLSNLSLTRIGESYGDWVASMTPEHEEVIHAVAAMAPAPALDAYEEGEITIVGGIAMMQIGGQLVPSPIADPIPNANIARIRMAVSDVDMMYVDGATIPAPVADALPDFVDTNEQFAMMEVSGESIPAPFADPLANEASDQEATDQIAQAIEVQQIAQKLASLNQWQRQAILSILNAPATEVAATEADSQQR